MIIDIAEQIGAISRQVSQQHAESGSHLTLHRSPSPISLGKAV